MLASAGRCELDGRSPTTSPRSIASFPSSFSSSWTIFALPLSSCPVPGSSVPFHFQPDRRSIVHQDVRKVVSDINSQRNSCHVLGIEDSSVDTADSTTMTTDCLIEFIVGSNNIILYQLLLPPCQLSSAETCCITVYPSS